MTVPAPRKPLFARRRRTAIEHGIQVGLFDWRELEKGRWPELELMHAVPNGAALKHGVKRTAAGKKVRYSAEGARLRREGLTAGIPDVNWPVARGPYHGMFIEHKSGEGDLSTEQAKKIRQLREQGHYVVLSRSAEDSIKAVRAYWNLGAFDPSVAPLEVPAAPKRRRKKPSPTPA